MKINNKVKEFFIKYTMVIALVLVFIVFDILTNGRMHYAQNISNLLLQNAYVVILACGMLLCILTGGNIDLSVGSVVCMSGALAAVLLQTTSINPIVIIGLCLVLALAVGVFQGYLIGYAKIPPFITTLAGMFVFRGIGRLILESKTISIKNEFFLKIFTSYIQVPGVDNGTWKVSALIFGIIASGIFVIHRIRKEAIRRKKGQKTNHLEACAKTLVISLVVLAYCYELSLYKGMPIMLVWVLIVVCFYTYITKKTSVGRYFYAVGGNEKATALSGINTKKVYFVAYTNVAFLAGLCGMLVAARVGSINGDAGTQYEMDAIGSCFIGGASAYGGTGTVGGAVIGAIVMGVINQGMSIYGIDQNWQYVIKGAVILLAVIFDIKINNGTGKKA